MVASPLDTSAYCLQFLDKLVTELNGHPSSSDSSWTRGHPIVPCEAPSSGGVVSPAELIPNLAYIGNCVSGSDDSSVLSSLLSYTKLR